MRNRRRLLVLIAGLLAAGGSVVVGVASSQEEEPQYTFNYNWPQGTSEEAKTAALEELLTNREADLARIREDMEKFAIDSSEGRYLLEKERALEDYIAALKGFLASRG